MDDTETPAIELKSDDLELQISNFIWVRDALAKVDKQWEDERADLVSMKERLEGRIHKFLRDHNITGSVKTQAGTAYTSTKYTASLADPKAFMDYVVNTGQFDLLERRASVTAVKQFIEDNNGQLPAGCNISSHTSLRVRR